MPNTVSAKKRLRQNQSRRLRNRSGRSALRTQLSKVREAVADKDAEKSETEFRTLVKQLDRAAAKHILHANAAARTKSRLSKAIKGIKAIKK